MALHVLLHTTEQKFFSARYQCVSCESTSPRLKFPISCATSIIKKTMLEVALYRAEPKNRVLKLEELRKFDKGEDFVFVWLEYKERMGRYFSLLQVYLLHADDIYVDFVRPDVSICEHFRNDKYGEEWRCWLRKPTEAERRETPWAGDSHE